MKKRPATKYCKNVAAIAAAWGAVVYVKSGLRQKQLHPAHAALLLPDFPKKTPFGWPKEEVVTWGLSHVALSKDRRTLTLLQSAVRSPQSAVPSPEEQVSLAEREAILAKLPPAYQTRYRELLEMHDHPNPLAGGKSLTEKQHQELIGIGLVKRGAALLGPTVAAGIGKPGPVELPEYCSQSEFARLMSELYNVPVYPMMVSNAINKEGMPGKMSNQSLKVSLAHPWWEEHKVKQEQQGSLFQRATAADLEKKIHEERRARIEADEAERSASNRWMPTSLIENFIEGAWTWVGMKLDKLIEDKRGLRRLAAESGAALGLSPEQLAQLDARLAAALPAANDQFKNECAGHMDELVRQLAAERKEQLTNRLKN